MTRTRIVTLGTVRWIAAVLIAALPAGPLAAADGVRLPADRVMRSAGESPGQVTFSHASHVDPKKPACTTCHPTQFSILKVSPRPTPAITHAAMDAGRYCGACHDGQAAFALDQCASCHRE